ncbi:MAG: bifunctional DNA-formamidopyrimidine glycosylase/DNA-(apurinic or apyrimidinic site) lyase [Alphaproteobacteria bacterium]|nr:bifunctional DNA-formamidopyrimidine glycosylase/DNA-(apurinic or apyrimidinic site) lyase [Alphaproteobacteria bacterium]
MPELPEVETVRRALNPVLKGRRLTRVLVRRRDLRVPLPRDFAARLAGRRVLAVDRRAKFLLARLDGGLTLVVHLGMSGRVRIFGKHPPPAEKHDHVELATDGGKTIRYNDARRFGLIALIGTEDLDAHPWFRGLGPEPLAPAFTGPVLAARIKGRRAPLKLALMDQKIVAGVGNIYASEALFRAGLSPKRPAGTVKGADAARLVRAVKAVLKAAIASGGSSLRDHRQPSGELGYFQHRFAVYDRAGRKCPGCDCDPARTGGIRRIVQGGRATFHCPRRQR